MRFFHPRLVLLLVACGFPFSACLAAEPLGRLFFTPERRLALERQRQSNVQALEQPLEGTVMSLHGIVARSGGKTTVWINGRPQGEDVTSTGVKARVSTREPGRAILVAGEEPAVALRVGESIDRVTRERKDIVGDGAVRVRERGRGGPEARR